jgi:hypothetical protein
LRYSEQFVAHIVWQVPRVAVRDERRDAVDPHEQVSRRAHQGVSFSLKASLAVPSDSFPQ